MKIIRVTSTAIAHPPADSLVELETDDGLTGISIGFAGEEAESLGQDVLVGEDPRAVAAHWQSLLNRSAEASAGDPDYRAIALLDMALWDLKAKSNGEPLWKSLGGARPHANAYASLPGLNCNDDEIAEWYEDMAGRHGFREAKLTVGLDLASDRRRLMLVRDVLMQTSVCPVLMIDADDRWTPEQAISNIKELEKEFDLTWVESSEQAWGREGLRQVSNNVFAAVCASVFPSFDRHAADVVHLDLQTTGITGSLQIADAAYGFELPVTIGASAGNTGAHLAAAMPNFMNMEVLEPASSIGFLASDVCIDEGRAVVGDKPGNGLTIDRDALAGVAG